MWDAVSYDILQRYQATLWQSFANFSFPKELDKCSLSCKSCSHQLEINSYLHSITELIHYASDQCIPNRQGGLGTKKRMFGWNAYVRPHQAAAAQSYDVWVAAGRPTTGDVFDNMKSDKKRYKYAVRIMS